ncbi:MAG: serine hydrolase domain-containing protein [bacterium]
MKYWIFLSLAMLIFCGVVFADAKLPETPAGVRAGEVLNLLNKGDKDLATEYIEKNYSPGFKESFPMTMHLGIFTTTNSMFGELEIYDIINSSKNEINLLLKSVSRDAFIKLYISVEVEQPNLIASMGLTPAQRPEGYKSDDQKSKTEQKGVEKNTKPIDPASINWKNIDNILSQKTDSNEFSGTVLIAKDGQPLFQNGYGYSSKEFKAKNNIDTKFNIGSINKLFTSIGIIQLLEQGKVSIDDPIGKYLDYFPREIADKITIRQLLQMRAGWGDYWGNEYFVTHRYDLRKLSEYMEFIKDIPLDFEPGTNFQHCNTCFEVLGAIIESVTGMDYYDYIHQNIYVPAGMTNTGSFHRDSVIDNIATGYTNMNQEDTQGKDYNWTNRYLLSVRGTPAGGGYSTVGDFLKFDQAFRNYKLLNKDYTHFIMSQYEGMSGDEFIPPNRMSMAMGGAPGIGAFYGRDLTNGFTILVFSNYDFTVVMETSNEIKKEMGLE